MIIKHLALTDKEILNIKQETKSEKLSQAFAKAIRCTLIKFLIFSFCNIVFLFLFWYYLSCFCAVYTNTQILLLKDTVISFCVSLLYPFIINLIPGILRNIALKKGNKYLFIISRLIALI